MAKTLVLKQGRYTASAWALIVALTFAAAAPSAEVAPVRVEAGDKLVYERDDAGNRIPDFSQCGYEGGNRDLPRVPTRVVVSPGDGDDGVRLQAAIDSVARLPIGSDGFRGAVQLAAGRFDVKGQLDISRSGIVLRGSGAGQGGTTIVATGLDRRPLVRIEGASDLRLLGGHKYRVVGVYVPVGESKLQLDRAVELKVGDRVLVTRPSTSEWIKAIGADAFGVGWRPGTRDIRWDRRITQIEGDNITLDAPITTSIEQQYGGATLEPYEWPDRISRIGVEDLRLESTFAGGQPHDEEHSWFGVTMQNVENAWVRRVEFTHFAGGAVSLFENTKSITIQDCISLDPISEVAGCRRHTFFTQGQLTLFLRCWSERGRHDFSAGHCAAGPNAFVNCYADDALDSSGPIESWASGVLYDNVQVSGAGLNLENSWIDPPGCGWSAANCVLWQCQAGTIRVFRPPTANNWAIGVWGGFAGDGTFFGRSDYVRPLSLYQAQLAARRGTEAAADVGIGLMDPIGATNPTLAEAAEFVTRSKQPARQLIDLIRENFAKAVISSDVKPNDAAVNVELQAAAPAATTKSKLELKNGWLVVDGKLKTGSVIAQPFWRGTIRPSEAATYPPALTRFVPGRTGTGFTDDLAHVADEMAANNVAGFDHHYGLWYDRRRDDHTMVRQPNSNVAPPFLEQPFARTGSGLAWNGLSKYDLTRFNPWYWQRLHDFAQQCDRRGLVLIHHNYFQHNILEAGAHWADCPWRPANNINETNLPEPPPYVGGKRIFIAPTFYDVSDPQRRALHRGFIRQCLDNFADGSNVIQMTSAEYSGPLEFTQFWLDTIIEWEREHGKRVLVGLSAPKDVQDAILNDATRAPFVDVIDIRYWAYTANDGLYAPPGGTNLAPRQLLRQNKLRPGGFAAIAKAVREYRTRFPDKAVTYNAGQNCPSAQDGWAITIGGGSLPDVKLPEMLAAIIPALAPMDGIVTGKDQWCLGKRGGDYVIYLENVNQELDVNAPNSPTKYVAHWIDSKTGEMKPDAAIVRDFKHIRPKANVLWLERKDIK